MTDPTNDGLRDASRIAEEDEEIGNGIGMGYLIALFPAAAAWGVSAYVVKFGEGAAIIPAFIVWMLVAGALERRAKGQ